MIPFIDVAAQRDRLRPKLDAAFSAVLDHGAFILGPQVSELEDQLSAFSGAAHTITCGNGTDALVLALRALEIGPGDAVLVPSFSFAATAEAVCLSGATPVFVDCRSDTFNVSADSVAAALRISHGGLKPRALIAVDLFGQPADYDLLDPLCSAEGIDLIVDAAQSFGSEWAGRRAGSIGKIATTSFFPAKPLGCFGDGGAIFTADDDLALRLRSLRVHGQGATKYESVRVGTNSRLDTLQAAILLVKLEVLSDELQLRQAVAHRYQLGLGELVASPVVNARATSAWAQYTIKSSRRDELATRVRRQGVPTAVYYPRPLHQQPAYRRFPQAAGGLPKSEQLSSQVLSLPMHPYLDIDTQERIITALREASGAN